MLSTVSISRLVIFLLIVNTCVSKQCPPRSCPYAVKSTFETEAPACQCEIDSALTTESGKETLACNLDPVKYGIDKSSRCRTECCDNRHVSYIEAEYVAGQCTCGGRCFNDQPAGVGSKEECAKQCCELCNDYEGRRRRESESESDVTPTGEESGNITSPPCTSVCYCYGSKIRNSLGNNDTGIPTNFEECSNTCDEMCTNADDCDAAPLFLFKGKRINDTWAENLLSEWQVSGVVGSVCACKEMGYMIGKNKNDDFDEGDCDDHCSQEGNGGIGNWTSIKAPSTPSPTTSSPTPSPTTPPKSNPMPWWSILIIIVGFALLVFTMCFLKPSSP